MTARRIIAEIAVAWLLLSPLIALIAVVAHFWPAPKAKPTPTPTSWPYGTPLPPGWGVYRVQVREGVTNMWIVEVERE